jgi:endoglycosylceramidase
MENVEPLAVQSRAMRRSLPAAAAVAFAVLVVALHPSAPAQGASASSTAVQADAPLMRDGKGRVVFFHGVNAVWKHAPYYPPSRIFGDGKSFFDQRDAKFLSDAGLNHVRLGLIFAGVMPERGRVDQRYLSRFAAIVEMLEQEGVRVLLDFHQDLYNERFGGEGFADWAVYTDGIPPTNVFGFPFDYFTPAVSHAFDNLWLNRDGLIDTYAEGWAATAKRLRRYPNVMGYDLFNEPWPGTQGATCFPAPTGCPAFELTLLQPFFERVIAKVRTVDRDHLAFWESHLWTSAAGIQNWTGLLHPVRDPARNTGLSFHAYCTATLGLPEPILRATDMPCSLSEEFAFRTHERAAVRNGSGMLLSEFGASDDVIDITRVAALADQHMASWDYWAFGNWNDPTGNPPEEGLWLDDLDRPGSLKRDKALVLIRTYPQAVAGTPEAFEFRPDRPDRRFTLTYRTDPRISAPTVVFVPVQWHYPKGYVVTVEGPAKVVSGRNAPRLKLANTGGGTVTVTVRRA